MFLSVSLTFSHDKITISVQFSPSKPSHLLYLLLLSLFRDTIELCRRAEHAHVAWITVHGRTVKQRAEPVNNEAVKMVRNNIICPTLKLRYFLY